MSKIAIKERTRERKYPFSLWVYVRSWSPSIRKALGSTWNRNQGGGCCTHGYADGSYDLKTEKAGRAILKKLTRNPDFAFGEVRTASGSNCVALEINPKAKLSAKAKARLKAHCRR